MHEVVNLQFSNAPLLKFCEVFIFKVNTKYRIQGQAVQYSLHVHAIELANIKRKSYFMWECFFNLCLTRIWCLGSLLSVPEMIASKTSTVDSWKIGIHQQITHFFLCLIFFIFFFFSFSIILCSFLRVAFSSLFLRSISLCSAASMSRRREMMGRGEGEEGKGREGRTGTQSGTSQK